jgi:hypothetical protein
VFISNVAWKAIAVSDLKPQGISWPSEALTAEIRTLLENDIASHTEQHKALWV